MWSVKSFSIKAAFVEGGGGGLDTARGGGATWESRRSFVGATCWAAKSRSVYVVKKIRRGDGRRFIVDFGNESLNFFERNFKFF